MPADQTELDVNQEKITEKPLPLLLAGGVLLTLAALFFTVVILPELRREERTLVVPIHVNGVPLNHAIVYQSHGEAHVRVKAHPDEFARQDLLRLQVTLPEEVTAEPAVHPVEVVSKHMPALTIQSITPPEVHLRLTKTASRMVKVIPHIKGTPAPGFQLGEVVIIPETTLITVPLISVHTLKEIQTTAVNVDGATESLVATVAPEATEITPVTFDPALFKVSVAIEETPVAATLSAVPITTVEEPRKVTITPSEVTLQVSGPTGVVNAMKEGKGVTAVIDTRELPPGLHVRRAAITLPEGVTLSSASPEIFTVIIKAKP